MPELFEISSSYKDNFSWNEGIPANLDVSVLKGMDCISLSGGWGDMVFQHRKIGQFEIWYSNYFIKERRSFKVRSDAPVVEFSFLIRNKVLQSITPFNEKLVKETQCNLYHLPYIEHIVGFNAEEISTTLDIHCSKEYLQKLTGYFPDSIEPLLNNIEKGKAAAVFATHIYATGHMISIAKEILRLLQLPNTNELLIELNVQILLGYALSCKSLLHKNADISLQQMSLINHLSTKIVKDLSIPPNIKRLSSEAGMNESYFRKLFKQIHAEPVYHYWASHRMEAARDLLLSSEHTISDIAWDLGFSAVTNFSKAFKKKYGVYPSELRK